MKKTTEIVIDAASFETKADIFEMFKEKLDSHDLTGHTLDALYDILTGIAVPTHIILTGMHTAHENIGGYIDRFSGMLADAASENPELSVTFK